MENPVLEALRSMLAREPRNGPLWLHYAELLEKAGQPAEALAALRKALELPDVGAQAERRMIPLLRQTGALAEALIRVEALLAKGEDAALRAELVAIQVARGHGEELAEEGEEDDSEEERESVAAEVVGESSVDDKWAAQFDWSDLVVKLADVVGLADVKRQIELRILAPYKNPEIYKAFQRDGGGGLLLYGPPGCGKTFVARAAAGELGARFLAVGIHDILDKFWGESEKAVHALFEHAREKSPTVLFFDEFDALGASRARGDSTFYKSIVDQLLQEMDGVGRKNRDVLVFAATNAPWSVDAAFRRPGRFDHVLFVPPPDEDARRELLRRHSEKLPGAAGLQLEPLVKRTELLTGADLKALCERAAEQALERSLASGKVEPVRAADFQAAAATVKSSALEWLSTAKNHARYANVAGQYDELEAYLKKIKRW
jgi:SpoVK/Ycf46/Vps4 family AAA+-type ATPase